MKYNTLAFAISLILSSQVANANPAGGQVIHGSATFSNPAVNVLNVTNSNNAIINWQSFNIGAGQTTNFIQPSAASSVLNRVISNNPSQLLGNLNSNGKVFLINQHGILVGAGAQINTAGFFGSTLNITDSDYLNGNLKFEGDSSAGISNQGYIHAGDNGNIVLIAANIENGGVIEVDNGNIILAAGQSITISSLENPAIQFEVTGSENTVTNLGKVLANQGSASLFAGTLKHSGSIRAGGLVQNADGSISLVAKASNQVSGSVDASGTQGGYVEILGDTVNIDEGANINASGDTAGGEILIGGDQQGLNPEIHNASSTTIAAGASVNADANTAGNGGKVIVFAEKDVHVHGDVSARGGALSGDGGFIETSGLLSLDITSVPDASAVNGKAGEWLIDPNNITIGPSTDSLITGDPDFISTDDSAYLSVTTLNAALDAGTNVTVSTGNPASISQAGDITILADIVSSSSSAVSLTLNAHNDIIFDAAAAGSNLGISAKGSGALNLILNPNMADSSGQVNFKTLGSVASFNVYLATNGGSLTVNGDTSITGGGALELQNTSWDVQQGHSVDMQFTTLDLDVDSVLTNGGDINMEDASVTGSGQFLNKGNINLNSSVTTSISTIDTQFIDFKNPGWIDIQANNTLTLTGGVLELGPGSGLSSSGWATINSSVTVNGGVIAGGDESTSPGTLTINGDLVFNSGGLYSVLAVPEGMMSSSVTADTVAINGGDLILNWQDSAAVLAAAISTNTVSVVGCTGTSCLSGSFDTIVDPIATTSAGTVDYGTVFSDTATYTIGSIDTTNLYQWTGLASTSWSDPGNWTDLSTELTATVAPDSSTDVFIDGTITPVVDITSTAAVRGIQAHGQINIGAGGSLDIAGNAFILEPTDGSGGLAISAPDAKVSRTGTGVLYNLGATLKLDQGTLSADTVNWGSVHTSATSAFQLDGNLVNNALFAIDATAGSNEFTGTGSIDNKGIMSWADGAHLTLKDNVTLSSSSIYAQFQGSGLLVLDNNASFAINNAPAIYSNTINWELVSGTISGVDNLTSLPDQIDWYGGTISGTSAATATLSSGQVMNLYGTTDMNLSGGFILENLGTINFLSSAGDLLIDGELDNKFDLNINNSSNTAGFGGGTLLNEGTINKISSYDFVAANSLFKLNGDLNISSGNFILQGASSFDLGFLNIATGAFFTVDAAGDLVFNAGFEGITGNGRFAVGNGGRLDLNSFTSTSHNKDFSSLAAVDFNLGQVLNVQDILLPATVNISAGILQGSGILSIPSATSVTVNGGGFSGLDSVNTLSVSNQGTINVSPGPALTLQDSSLNITSGALSGSGDIDVRYGASLIADGTVDIARIILSGGTLTANSFTYAGNIKWDSGTINGGGSGLTTSGQVDLIAGVLNTNWTIAPTGTVKWLSPDYAELEINNATITNKGEFNIGSYVDITAATRAAKNFSLSTNAAFINEGLLIIDSDAFPDIQGPDEIVFDLIFENAGGTIAIKSGTFRIESGGVAQDLRLDAGESLQGFGTFDGNVINVAGTVSPGKSDVTAGVYKTGTLTITGDFIQQVDGDLVIKMDSTASGLIHDKLNVGGELNAGGGIKFAVINGKTPVELALLLDQSFKPISYARFANRFDSVAIPPGLNFTFSNTGLITITSSNQDLINISNQLETLFDNKELDHQQMVKAMQFIDKAVSIETNDEEDDEKKRAPRLVCR